MKQTFSIFRKEWDGYFGSPMALIFMGAFLAATFFSFFWVDTFFARGIADVRPLFRWMPILMIFLVAAITMRQWSEEQRSGTLEILLTLPVSYIQLVIGKFLAVIALVGVALMLTLSLPVTVSILGNLDWGPVFGGYLATVLLASGYAAIGLFVSSRTDNQIVALISTVLLCGVTYMLGSGGLTSFLPDAVAEIFKALGTGSRFESIERGVIDLRDLLYYVSLTGIFLTLNVTSLDEKRWSIGLRAQPHRRDVTLRTVLIALNLVVLNVWIFPVHGLRLDLTQHKEFSLSPTTRDLLGNLQEPLVIRGYFSERTHPLLAPLVPRIRDMLSEYDIASQGKIDFEIIDPSKDPEKEAEATQVYGIQPAPFQVAGRYESSIINSYFHILIRYGDQSIVLDYSDLIEVERRRDDSLDVRLRNLEYDLTRSIKKVVYGFQSVDAVLSAMSEPVYLTVFITPKALPEWFEDAPATIEKVARDIQVDSGGKFNYEIIDPDAPDSPITRQGLYDTYGLQPIQVSLFSEETYYLYLVLQIGDQAQLLYPTGDLSEAEVLTSIESALKRASPGFLKVVGLWQPPAIPTQDMFGNTQQPISSWQLIAEQLSLDYEVRTLDLTSGSIPSDVDVAVLIAPQGLNEVEQYAVDQYLMRGGAVVVAAGNYGIQSDPFSGGLGIVYLEGGLQELLESFGIRVEPSLVMDSQNEPFPVPVTREVGGFLIQEIELMDYPFFVDIRQDGMNEENQIVSNLQAVTLNWASPVQVDEDMNVDRQVELLLESSSGSWLKHDTNIQPDFDLYPELGFTQGEKLQPYPLAVSITGIFESFYKGKPSPLEALEEEERTEGEAGGFLSATIEASPDSSRLVVIGSAEFIDDAILRLSSSSGVDRYFNSLQLMQNAVDWSVEDLDLLNIRSRGTFVRVLNPMDEGTQSRWELANYALALLALIVISILRNLRRSREQPMELVTEK